MSSRLVRLSDLPDVKVQKQIIQKLNPTATAVVELGSPYADFLVGVAFFGRSILHPGVHAYWIKECDPLSYEKCKDPDIIKASETFDWRKYDINLKKDRVNVYVQLKRYGDLDSRSIDRYMQELLSDTCEHIKEIMKKPSEQRKKLKQQVINFDSSKLIYDNPRGLKRPLHASESEVRNATKRELVDIDELDIGY